MSTKLDERPDVRTTDGEDRDRFTHIVFPKDKLAEAMITGNPTTALCGKVFVPTRDPKRYPICPTCIEVCEERGWDVPNG